MNAMLAMISQLVIAATGFAAALLFMYGLKRMSSPATAASGIRVAGAGMLAAVLAAFLYFFNVGAAAKPHLFVNLGLAILALAIGGTIAWWSGKTVKMTAMPQMVAIYNGMGGGAAAAIAAVELFGNRAGGQTQLIVTLFGAIIGAISLSGSIIAWAKLDRILKVPLQFAGQQILNGAAMLATVVVGGAIVVAVAGGPHVLPLPGLICLFFGCALVFGILMTLPIGGADMPVVISIYNAFTGIAVGLEGYVLQNPALMIAGMVVGAAGTLLTVLMAKAMNRSIFSVLFKHFGADKKYKHSAHRRQRKAGRSERRRDRHALCQKRHHRSGLWPRRLARTAEALRLRQAPRRPPALREVRDPSGRGPHARPDGRAARRGRRALRHDFPARRH